MTQQKEIYKSLVKNEVPEKLNDIWAALNIFEWPRGESIAVAAHEIVAILKRYQGRDLTAQQVEDWANLIEAAGVAVGGLGDMDGDAVVDVIHDLANPALEGPLTPEVAAAMIARLEEAGGKR